MDEQTMLNDILNSVKAELINYENMIVQTENQGLRQMLIQIRNNQESFEYELYKVAKVKGYYKEPQVATSEDIRNTKDNIK